MCTQKITLKSQYLTKLQLKIHNHKFTYKKSQISNPQWQSKT